MKNIIEAYSAGYLGKVGEVVTVENAFALGERDISRDFRNMCRKEGDFRKLLTATSRLAFAVERAAEAAESEHVDVEVPDGAVLAIGGDAE